MPKPYEIVIPLFDDEKNFIKLMDSLIGVGISPSIVIVSMSGPVGNIDGLRSIYGFRLVHSDRKLSPSVTRNKGAEYSQADYIVFLDSDVVVTTEWKSALDEISSKKVTLFTGDTVHVSNTPNWIELFWFARIRGLSRRYINGANIVVQRELFETLGGFDETLDSGEDYDLSVRATDFGARPILNEQLKVFHEGYPKTIKEFVKREFWHASGDLVSLGAFFKSNVMLAASLYFLIMFLAIISLIIGSLSGFLLFFAFDLIILISLTIYKLGWNGKETLISMIIMKFYLMGRGAALMKTLSRPLTSLLNSKSY